jgi:hypothetical protein
MKTLMHELRNSPAYSLDQTHADRLWWGHGDKGPLIYGKRAHDLDASTCVRNVFCLVDSGLMSMYAAQELRVHDAWRSRQPYVIEVCHGPFRR